MMKSMMKTLALVLALVMVVCCFAACGNDAKPADKDDMGTTVPGATEPTNEPEATDPEPSVPVDDGKKEYKITVTDANGNPLEGVMVQICKEGSTCFTPTRTNDKGVATWRLDEAGDYYGTVSSVEEGMPKEYFGDGDEVTLVYQTQQDTKKEYKIVVTDAEGNPVSGVLVQVCKEGSTCFVPTRTNEQGEATWKLDQASDYYGTVSSIEEGMPKEYFGDGFQVTLVYIPSVG